MAKTADKQTTKKNGKTKRFSVLETDHSVKGGAEMYGSARRKLWGKRGKAEEHTCGRKGCKNTAAAWILTPKKDAEIWLAPRADGTPGLRFSRDPADYTALCREHQKAAQAKKTKEKATA